MLQTKIQVMKEHGKIIEVRNLPAGVQVKYFLTLHPAAVMRFQKNRPFFEEDFTKLKKLLK